MTVGVVDEEEDEEEVEVEGEGDGAVRRVVDAGVGKREVEVDLTG
jgi:hypothetical protein